MLNGKDQQNQKLVLSNEFRGKKKKKEKTLRNLIKKKETYIRNERQARITSFKTQNFMPKY